MAEGLVAVALLAALLPTASAVYCPIDDVKPWSRISLVESVGDNTLCRMMCDNVESKCYAVSYNSKSKLCALLGQAEQQKGIEKRCSEPQSIEKRFPGNICPTNKDHTTQAATEQSDPTTTPDFKDNQDPTTLKPTKKPAKPPQFRNKYIDEINRCCNQALEKPRDCVKSAGMDTTLSQCLEGGCNSASECVYSVISARNVALLSVYALGMNPGPADTYDQRLMSCTIGLQYSEDKACIVESLGDAVDAYNCMLK